MHMLRQAEWEQIRILMPMLDKAFAQVEVLAPVGPSPMQDDEAVPHVEASAMGADSNFDANVG